MSQQNPLTANLLHCDPADTAAEPSIAFGDCDGQKSGTGIHGDASSVKVCVNGTDVATFNSGGLVGPSILALSSSPGAGGAASEAMTVPGLLASDTVLSVSQSVPGANSLPLLGFNTQANNSLTVEFSADPGAGAVILVAVKR
jgi:hypothetical protein